MDEFLQIFTQYILSSQGQQESANFHEILSSLSDELIRAYKFVLLMDQVKLDDYKSEREHEHELMNQVLQQLQHGCLRNDSFADNSGILKGNAQKFLKVLKNQTPNNTKEIDDDYDFSLNETYLPVLFPGIHEQLTMHNRKV